LGAGPIAVFAGVLISCIGGDEAVLTLTC